MLQSGDRIAIYMEGALASRGSKMGIGTLRYSPHVIACLIDSENAGQDVVALTGVDRSVPIVASLNEAKELGANVLLLGIAPPGGLIPVEWYATLDEAVGMGLSIVNGLHDLLSTRYPNLADGQWIWDIRQEPDGVGVGTGEARNLKNKRVLFVGTDMSVGKMTAGLELHKLARSRGINAEFIATGQVGITIMGRGVPLDCIRVDFAAGAMERAVLDASTSELVIIEGQGSLVHPGSSSTLPLLRGAQPTHLVLCHRAGMTELIDQPWVKIPPLKDLAQQYEDLAEVCGVFRRPVTAAICLNTSHLPEKDAERVLRETEREVGMPVCDAVRFGAERILDALNC
ncbi:MAG: DUF1611 domain-containing protein [Armatimonadetes bacterium]|nr:DUF1611 domain-containing protein [Armatimonadota bacterium]